MYSKHLRKEEHLLRVQMTKEISIEPPSRISTTQAPARAAHLSLGAPKFDKVCLDRAIFCQF